MKKTVILLFIIVLCNSLFSENSNIVTHQTYLFKFSDKSNLPISNSSFGISGIDTFLRNSNKINISRLIRSAKDKSHPLHRIYRLEIETNLLPKDIIQRLSDFEEILLIEAEPKNNVLESPNDPRFVEQEFLSHLNSENCWDIHKSEDGYIPTIAIVDTGVLWNHEDLYGNIYQNLGEDIDGDGIVALADGTFDPDDINGIDDDGNGYIDDFIGWDFYGNDNNPSYGSHGTKVAGYASSVTNNSIGVASIAWNAKLLPIKAGSSSSISKGYEGIIYAAENGADVINTSWGGNGYSAILQEIIDYAESLGSIVVAAAGNSNNQTKLYPASYHKVISVANTNLADQKYGSSTYNYAVDVSAPGASNLTTNSSGGYDSNGAGTSYSSPVAASLLAMIKSYHPDWNAEQIKTQLLFSSTDINGINPNYENMLGYGRIDAYSALTGSANWNEDLKIYFNNIVSIYDSNNNLAIEPNENVSLDLEFSIYSFHSSPLEINLTLSCDDPLVTIVNNSAVCSVTSDTLIVAENAFDIHFDENITSRSVPMNISVSSENEIVSDSEFQFDLLVNAGGILVFEGEENSNDFSGTYIKNYLENLNYNVILTTDFPASFAGFDAVFLSFGSIDGSTVRLNSQSMEDAITDYLISGGNIYIEGSDTIGFDLGYYLQDTSLWQYLGISLATDGVTNSINELVGQAGSIAEGLIFTSSNQANVSWIDKFEADENGIILFTESDYGNTAIQNSGSYGQKTIVSSYSLSKLVDNGASTKDELLSRIMSFFREQNSLDSPENVTISISNNCVEISWDNVEWASSYKVFSSDNPNSGFEEELSGTFLGTSWQKECAETKKFYYVKAIRAEN